jgi:hypothetical protein
VGDALVRSLDTRELDDEATDFQYGIPQLLKSMNTQLTASSTAVAAASPANMAATMPPDWRNVS